jgi:type II secretory pathway pseudopilin PulG
VSTLAVIIVVVVVVLVLLIVGGLVASGRRARAQRAELRRTLREAEEALALARAQDMGWERATLEAAARAAFAERSPAEVRELLLIRVVDPPGTQEDQAVFRVITDAGAEEVLLVRRDDAWVAS